jgi:NAD(P) transhydrogenase subunit beta
MPVLNVENARRVIICNFDDKPGYAGVPNPLYQARRHVMMMYGDAKESLQTLIAALE